jgi:hypothetical protein
MRGCGVDFKKRIERIEFRSQKSEDRRRGGVERMRDERAECRIQESEVRRRGRVALRREQAHGYKTTGTWERKH